MALKCTECGNKEFKEQIVKYAPEIKGEAVEVKAMAFVCTKCKASTMTTEQMSALQKLSADEYRKKHKLLTSKQIVDCRKKLAMSQADFAKYLGVGSASIARWETFAIQEKSQDELIRLKCDERYARHNSDSVNANISEPDILSGNMVFNPNKLKALLMEFVSLAKSALYINKVVFYADFFHFQLYNQSISGSRYLPFKHGPCPQNYADYFNMALKEGLVKKINDHDLKLVGSIESNVFNEKEIETINAVKTVLKKKGARYLFNKSHDEKAYKKAEDFVSYEYAKNLLIDFRAK